MAAPVVVKFQVEGVAQVQNAFRTVEQSATSAVKSGANERIAQGQREAKDRIRAYKDMFDQISKQEKDSARASKQAEDEKVRATKAATAEKERTEADFVRKINKWTQEAVNDFDRAERAKTTAAKRELAQRESDARRHRELWARAIGHGAAQGVGNGLRKSFSVGAGMVNSVLSLGGGFDIADSVQKTIGLRGTLADIANSGFIPSDPRNDKKVSTADLEKDVRSAATRYGYTEESAAHGLQQFTKVSGDLKTARELLGPLASLSRATASNLDEMAEAAGNVSMALGPVENKGKKVMEVMRSLGGQGKAGAVEISDLVKQVPKMVAAAGKFEGNLYDTVGSDGKTVAGNISKLGAMAQVARGGGGAWSASSAGTAVTQFAAVFGKDARLDAFEEMGIRTEGKDGKRRDMQEIVKESIVKSAQTGEMQRSMNHLYGGIFADRAVAGFGTAYMDASAKTTGTKAQKEAAGATAIDNLWAKYLEDAAITEEKERDAATERMQETDMKLAVLSAKFNEILADKLLPKFMELLPVLEKLVPQFIDLAAIAIPQFLDMAKSIAEFAQANRGIIMSMAEHPIGSIIAIEVTKSIAMAAIGEGVRIALMGPLAAALGPAAIALALLAAAALAGKMAIDSFIETENNKTRTVIGNSIEADAEAKKLDRGDFTTDSELEVAQKMAAKLKKNIEGERDNLAPSLADQFAQQNAWAMGVDQKEADQAFITKQRSKVKQLEADELALKKLNESILNATTHLSKLADAAGGVVPNRDKSSFTTESGSHK